MPDTDPRDGIDPLELLDRALDQAGVLIAGTGPAQAALPTPCASFDLRDLVNHVVLDTGMFAETIGGRPYTVGREDVIGEDWAGAYRAAASALSSAWRRHGPLDEAGTRRVYNQIANYAVHAWDIARATGVATALDPRVGQAALDFMRANLRPQFRGAESDGKVFGPEVEVPADAPLYDRLAAFAGRDPAGGRDPAAGR